jgi:hypothetical protein
MSIRVVLPRAFTLVGCQLLLAASAPPAARAQNPPSSAVERGKYLVTFAGCHDCHTPKAMTSSGPEPDMSRALSGHPSGVPLPPTPGSVVGPGKWGAVTTADLTAWYGPWGVSFAANLTPDPTGLGPWTKAMFIRALRTGKHQGEGRPILPPMPWQNYAQMTDGDLGAVFDYLRTLKPVRNAVPAPIPPTAPPRR